MKEFVAAVASDETYLLGAMGTLASLRLALDVDIHLIVVFLHDGLSDKSQALCSDTIQKLTGRTDIQFKRINADFSQFPRFPGATQLTYARLLLPDLVHYNRVVYLDVDLLIFKDLQCLMECEVSEIGLAAVVDRGILTIGGDFHPNCRFPVDLAQPYFNGGLMVMDLQKIRVSKLFDKALEYLNTHPEFCKVWDQSAMNYAANGRFRILEDFFNFQNSRYYFSPAEFIQPLIKRDINVHFVSRQKPWRFFSSYPPETMYRILMDLILPDWKPKGFNNCKLIWQVRMLFVDLHPKLYLFRGAMKKILGFPWESDFRTSENWKIKSKDIKELKKNKKSLKELYSGWSNQIKSRMA